jgi:hypothetical protein
VAYCHVCDTSWPAETENCPVCGKELKPEAKEPQWVLIGSIVDKWSADLARETLASYDIPAVVMSKSGYFGNVGLTMTSFYSGEPGLFEISVPLVDAEEAVELLQMTLGEKWQKREE